MALFAGDKGIMTGAELTYDYNFDPYSQKNVQECRCGAKNCRGVLGPKTKEEKKPKTTNDRAARPESRLAGAKRKIAEAIDERLHKKKKVLASKTSPAKIRKKRVSSMSTASIIRRPSKLRRILASTKNKSASRRVMSSSSASQTLIMKEATKTLSRSESVKAKASTLKKSVVRTVRGGQHGKERSIRPILDED